MSLTWTDIGMLMARLSAALLCGAVLGWERETAGKAAGFRTNILIALGAAAFTLLSLRLINQPGQTHDPLRVMQGLIGGIGFLGAGAVIRSGGSIHGMTTAATIWVVGAAGVACGMGAYDVAVVCVVFCFLVLRLLDVVEKKVIHDDDDTKPHPPASDPNNL